MADTVGRHLLQTSPADIYVGSPPIGFTFGLGALLVFPLRFRGAGRSRRAALARSAAAGKQECVRSSHAEPPPVMRATSPSNLTGIRRIQRWTFGTIIFGSTMTPSSTTTRPSSEIVHPRIGRS